MQQLSFDLLFVLRFYLDNIYKTYFPGDVDYTFLKIKQYGTPCLLTERGFPILARYSGLSLVMSDTGMNEWNNSSCGEVKTVSLEEYLYRIKMNRELKIQRKKELSANYSPPKCRHCNEEFSSSDALRKHFSKSQECFKNTRKSEITIHSFPWSNFREIALAELNKQPFMQGRASY